MVCDILDIVQIVNHILETVQLTDCALSAGDYNGDGFISLEEMTRYLASVFKVMYETQPGTAEQMGVSAEDLATVTAEQAFEDLIANVRFRGLSFEKALTEYVNDIKRL